MAAGDAAPRRPRKTPVTAGAGSRGAALDSESDIPTRGSQPVRIEEGAEPVEEVRRAVPDPVLESAQPEPEPEPESSDAKGAADTGESPGGGDN
jgi:hypothetical protein